MKAFKLKFDDERCEIVYGKTALEVIKKHDLATRKHVNTRIIELAGEQLAIALANMEYTSI